MRKNEGNGFPANEGKTMRENVGKLGKIRENCGKN